MSKPAGSTLGLLCRVCGIALLECEPHDGATWHMGRCDHCDRVTGVTEPRDFVVPLAE